MVTDQQHRGPRQVNRLEQVPGQRHVHHRKLVDHQDVDIDGVLLAARETLAVIAEQTVDGGAAATADFFQALCCLAGRRGEHDLQIALLADRVDDRNGVALARTGSTRNQADAVVEGRAHRFELLLVQR